MWNAVLISDMVIVQHLLIPPCLAPRGGVLIRKVVEEWKDYYWWNFSVVVDVLIYISSCTSNVDLNINACVILWMYFQSNCYCSRFVSVVVLLLFLICFV